MAKNNTVEKRNSILGMSFFGPALVLMALFLFIPMILTLVFSFTDFFALNPSLTSFVGLDNYVALFRDRLFVQAFGNTILFVIIIVPFQMGLAFGLALFIDKISYCKTYFKFSFSSNTSNRSKWCSMGICCMSLSCIYNSNNIFKKNNKA